MKLFEPHMTTSLVGLTSAARWRGPAALFQRILGYTVIGSMHIAGYNPRFFVFFFFAINISDGFVQFFSLQARVQSSIYRLASQIYRYNYKKKDGPGEEGMQILKLLHRALRYTFIPSSLHSGQQFSIIALVPRPSRVLRPYNPDSLRGISAKSLLSASGIEQSERLSNGVVAREPPAYCCSAPLSGLAGPSSDPFLQCTSTRFNSF